MKLLRDIPRRLTINGNQWTVHFFRNPPAVEKLNEELFGICKLQARQIYIKLGQTPGERFSTLVHELLHALEFEFGISIPHELINALEGPLAALFLELFATPRRRRGRRQSRG